MFIKKLTINELCAIILIVCIMSRGQIAAQTFRWSNTIINANTFSSPRFSDFNNDGVLDVVMGAGVENGFSAFGVLAFDGITGDTLWTAPSLNQVFGSALLLDISGDGIDDVIIGGRSAHFKAYDGTTGSELWSFSPDSVDMLDSLFLYNFYTPQKLGDLNGDGIPELVNTYGGGRLGLREPGFLMVINGKTGGVMAIDTVPDFKETFCSPLVHDFNSDGVLEVIFGTGGEQYGGSLWSVTLTDLLNGKVELAREVYRDSIKGFIAVPSLADINEDWVLDIIAPTMNQHVAVIDGRNDNLLWRSYSVGTEGYTSPSIGKFVGTQRPDIFATYAWGQFPNYNNFIQTVIDGQNGIQVWFERDCQYQFGSPLALDWDGDGLDEVIVLLNRNRSAQAAPKFEFVIRLYDFNDQTTFDLSPWRSGVQVFTSPALKDLNGDGTLELIYAYSKVQDKWYHSDEFTIECIDLNRSAKVAWSGYLGNAGDGKYYPENVTSSIQPSQGTTYLGLDGRSFKVQSGFKKITFYDALGRALLIKKDSKEMDLSELPAGWYFYLIEAPFENVSGSVFLH